MKATEKQMKRLIELRTEKKISQRKLAKILNVTQPMVSGWEKGLYQIDNDTLKVLADFFNVTIDYLLCHDTEYCYKDGEIVNNLKFYRNKKEYTQKQVAGELKITPATYSRYESGILQPDPSTLLKLSHIYHVTIDELLGNDVVISTGKSSLLGKNLIELRKVKGVNQGIVADYLGICRTSYTKYENDIHEPDLNTLKKIADYFDVSIDYILGRGTDSNAGKPKDLIEFLARETVALNGRIMTEQDKERIKSMLEILYWNPVE